MLYNIPTGAKYFNSDMIMPIVKLINKVYKKVSAIYYRIIMQSQISVINPQCYVKLIFCTDQHSRSFPIVISLCMPLHSITCVQKGYLVIDLVDGS